MPLFIGDRQSDTLAEDPRARNLFRYITRMHRSPGRSKNASRPASDTGYLVPLNAWQSNHRVVSSAEKQRFGTRFRQCAFQRRFRGFMATIAPQYEATLQAFEKQLARIKAANVANAAEREVAAALKTSKVTMAENEYKKQLPTNWDKDKG